MRVLAYTAVGRGHLYPIMPILLELGARGHDVQVHTRASTVATARDSGLDAQPLDPRIEAVVPGPARVDPIRDFAAGMEMFSRRAVFEAPDLRAAIAAATPDVLIVDANAWGAMAAAEASGLPWACFSASPVAFRSRGVPPFGPGLAPARGIVGEVRDRVVGFGLDVLARRIAGPRINRARSAAGLPALTDPDDFYRRPPVLLAATAPPFEYRYDDCSNLVQIGACEWDPPSEPLPWLDRIEEPVVLVTTSSDPQKDEVLVRRTISALVGTGFHVVATMPAGVPDDIAGAAGGPGVTVVEYASHTRILERAAVAVTHGGMGGTQKALAHGVPVVAVPFGRDQFEVARRVEVAGAGVRLPARRIRDRRRGPALLRSAVVAASEMADGARSVAAGYAAAGGPRRAADLLEAAHRR